MNDGSPKGNDILVNAAVQATLISLKDEIEAGATLGDVYEIVTGLLYFAQGNRIH
jgi:hypothetical protein